MFILPTSIVLYYSYYTKTFQTPKLRKWPLGCCWRLSSPKAPFLDALFERFANEYLSICQCFWLWNVSGWIVCLCFCVSMYWQFCSLLFVVVCRYVGQRRFYFIMWWIFVFLYCVVESSAWELEQTSQQSFCGTLYVLNDYLLLRGCFSMANCDFLGKRIFSFFSLFLRISFSLSFSLRVR